MAIPLEDNFTDIISKAQCGLEISDSRLAEKSAVSIQQIQKIRGGELDQDAIRAIAPVLGLDPESLLESALGKWKPETLPSVHGLAQFTTPYHDFTVNAYLVWAERSSDLVFFGRKMPTTCIITLDSILSVSCLEGAVVFWQLW
jgi:hypothetical protein